MKQYRWHKIDGVVDAETGRQVLQLAGNCTKKFRAETGKILVELLNVHERANAFIRDGVPLKRKP
jgi:hypothetical protein